MEGWRGGSSRGLIGLAGRECAGVDWVDGAAGDDGLGGVEEVGFGFGVGGEFVVVAKEVEEISGRILQAGQYFLVSFWEKRSDLFSQNGGVVTWQGCVQKFQKIGQTYFLENEHCRLGLEPGLRNEGLII